MFKFLNDKLYNQFYPLETEEDKNDFLNSYSTDIYREVRDICHTARSELSARQYDYISQMKSTVSFLGTPKMRNIAHNKYIVQKMYMDKHIRIIEEKIPDLDSLAYKLMYLEYENITNDELNYILRFANTKKHKTWMMFFVLLILTIVFICILK